MANIDVKREQSYKEKLKKEVQRRTQSFSCRIFLFGSRVHGRLRRSSDFDLGVSEISKEDFFRVKNLLEGIEDELNIPHSVDIINFDTADDEFIRQVTLQGVEVWKQS